MKSIKLFQPGRVYMVLVNNIANLTIAKTKGNWEITKESHLQIILIRGVLKYQISS